MGQKTERATGLDRRTREEIQKSGIKLTALRFQMGVDIRITNLKGKISTLTQLRTYSSYMQNNCFFGRRCNTDKGLVQVVKPLKLESKVAWGAYHPPPPWKLLKTLCNLGISDSKHAIFFSRHKA